MKITLDLTEAEAHRLLAAWRGASVALPLAAAELEPEPAPAKAETSPLFASSSMGSSAPAWWVAQGNPAPGPQQAASVEATLNALPKLTDSQRDTALDALRAFLVQWLEGWEVEGVTQPNRADLMQALGVSRHAMHIVVLGYECLSLQRLVRTALSQTAFPVDDLDFIDRLSANLVQVAGLCGFPELAGTYDYSNAWRR